MRPSRRNRLLARHLLATILVADEPYLWLITTRFHPPLISFYIARIAVALL